MGVAGGVARAVGEPAARGGQILRHGTQPLGDRGQPVGERTERTGQQGVQRGARVVQHRVPFRLPDHVQVVQLGSERGAKHFCVDLLVQRAQFDRVQLGQLCADLRRARRRAGNGRIGQSPVALVVAEVGSGDRVTFETTVDDFPGEIRDPADRCAQLFFTAVIQ